VSDRATGAAVEAARVATDRQIEGFRDSGPRPGKRQWEDYTLSYNTKDETSKEWSSRITEEVAPKRGGL
jgi:hypothetical protein